MPQGDAPTSTEGIEHRAESTDVLDGEVEGLVSALTNDELVGLLCGSTEFWPGLTDMMTGGYHRHPWPAAEVTRLGIGGIHFVDGPRGVVVGPATAFPVPMARGATWDLDLEERIGDAIGVEVRSVGATLFGGVCVNVLRHPGWGRAQETYGEDPLPLGEMGAALTRGVQRHAMACVKHFAANSIENARFTVDVRASRRALHEVYLPHFHRIVDEGVASVMSAYNSLNGEWCGQNVDLLGRILKDRWGFDGFVMTDFIFGLRDAVAGVRAGQDLEMPFRNLVARQLSPAVADASVARSELEDSARRLIRQQLRFCSVGDPERYDASALAAPAHRDLAREAARKSIVLLRNEPVAGQPVLPLDRVGIDRVVVVGELAAVANLGDHGSSDVMAPSVVTPLDGLRAAVAGHTDVVHADGSDLDEARRMAADADAVVVVVGCTAQDEGEFITPDVDHHLAGIFPPDPRHGASADPPAVKATADQPESPTERRFGQGGDRRSLGLSSRHEKLVRMAAAANPRTIVVLMGGSAILTTAWQDDVAAIVMAWYPGMEGGHALADVLLGTTSPVGRLPFSWPADAAHLPPFDPDATSVVYDLWHGYRLVDRSGHEPAYPFGFGLSYTTVEYDSVVLSDDEITADGGLLPEVSLANTGGYPTDEVAQVYAAPIDPPVERPVKHLVAFARVPLAVGEHTTVTLPVPASRLARFDEAVDDFVVDPGRWELRVGPHAGSQPLTVRFTVTDRARIRQPRQD